MDLLISVIWVLWDLVFDFGFAWMFVLRVRLGFVKLSDENSNLVCESDGVGLESTELLLVYIGIFFVPCLFWISWLFFLVISKCKVLI